MCLGGEGWKPFDLPLLMHTQFTNVRAFTSRSGRLNSIFLSSRPGLVRAGSRVSGLKNNNKRYFGIKKKRLELKLLVIKYTPTYKNTWITNIRLKLVNSEPFIIRTNSA